MNTNMDTNMDADEDTVVLAIPRKGVGREKLQEEYSLPN